MPFSKRTENDVIFNPLSKHHPSLLVTLCLTRRGDVDELHSQQQENSLSLCQSQKPKSFCILVFPSTDASRFHLPLICFSFGPWIRVSSRRRASCGVLTAGRPRQPAEHWCLCPSSPRHTNGRVNTPATPLSSAPPFPHCALNTLKHETVLSDCLDHPDPGTMLSQG